MRKNILITCKLNRYLPVCGLLALSGPVLRAATYDFNTASGVWENSANWTPTGLPAAGDEAHIGTAAAQSVTIGTGITAEAAKVQFANGGTLHLTGTLTSTRVNGYGTLEFDGGTLKAQAAGARLDTATSSNLPGTSYIANGGAVIDTNGFDLTVGGDLANTTGQTGSLTKLGNGLLTLGGHGSFTGPLTVSQGTLTFGSKGYLDTTVLNIGQSGTILNTGIFGYTDIAPGTQLTMDLGGSGTNGYFTTGGGILWTDGVNLILNLSTGAVGTGDTWNLFDMASQGGDFTSVSLTGPLAGGLTRSGEIWTGTAGGFIFEFNQETGNLGVTGAAVPEPSTGLLLLTCLGFLGRRRR